MREQRAASGVVINTTSTLEISLRDATPPRILQPRSALRLICFHASIICSSRPRSRTFICRSLAAGWLVLIPKLLSVTSSPESLSTRYTPTKARKKPSERNPELEGDKPRNIFFLLFLFSSRDDRVYRGGPRGKINQAIKKTSVDQRSRFLSSFQRKGEKILRHKQKVSSHCLPRLWSVTFCWFDIGNS